MDIIHSTPHPLRRLSTLIVVLLLPLLSSMAQSSALERLFAPKAERWGYWDSSDPEATQQIDHSGWSTFLGRYVLQGEDGTNRVRYSQVSDADRQQLKRSISALEQLPIRSYNAEQQLSYWIKLYNA